MTTWQEVFERGREVARILRTKRRPAVLYENHSGAPVTGWRLYEFSVTRSDTEYSGDSDYKDVWTNRYLVLGNDGVIYMFSLVNTENGKREPGGFRVTTDRVPSVQPVRQEALRLTAYETLQSGDVMRLLGNLAKKANFSPEPAAPSSEGSETFSKDPTRPEVVRAVAAYPIPSPAPAQTAWMVEEKKESGGSWKVTLLLTVGPFVFLTLLVLVLVLLGARPN